MSRVVYFAFVSLIFKTVTICSGCDEALVGSAKLSASSTLSPDRGAEKARPDSGSAWTAKNSDFEQYLMISLSSKKTVTSIVTMGKQYSPEFVQEFKIFYGDNGGDFTEYKDREGNTKLFQGNSDGDSQVHNVFETPIIAQYIRINPTRWRDRISLRVELYGCEYEAESLQLDGQSFVVMALGRRPVTSAEDAVRLRFRTNHADGLLLYSRGSQRDLLALQLVHNRLLLSVDLGGEGLLTEVWCGSLLDDNVWHDVQVSRFRRQLVFTVDRVVVRQRLRGDSFQLDLNRELYIGGMANFNQDGVKVAANFSGCLENVMLNDTNVIGELKRDYESWTYSKVGQVLYSCRYEQVIPVTFVKSESMLRIGGYMQRSMNCSFDFRTFNEQGLLLYNKFTGEGYVKLFLDMGRIRVELQGKGTPVVLLKPFDDLLNDGRWHRLTLALQTNRIELHLDGVPSITKRLFSMETGIEYLVGGGVYGMRGFIGCMRYLYVEGRYINVLSLPPNQVQGELLRDTCHMVDRCHPNPCEHGGLCKQDHRTFACNCTDTGYAGAVCHLSLHPLSCAAYQMKKKPEEQSQRMLIDVDGSGPLTPFPVECVFHPDNRTDTLVHHKNEMTTDVKGYREAGSFIQDIVYDAPMEQMVQLVNRSAHCRQRLTYECYNARLFDTSVQDSSSGDSFAPYGWWVSRSNQKMDYWGGSIPGSRKCRCGLYGSCVDPQRWCNCDAALEEWHSDGGELTDRDYLPVRQLRFGDTGAASLLEDRKRGRYTLGPLECEGDALFDDVVTFRFTDATIEVPHLNLRHSWDVYFHFKTTAENGVLMHSKGPTDFVKLVISGGDRIQLLYETAGGGPQGVSVKTSYKLSNDEWHSVHVERNRKQARIVVDGSQSGEADEKPDRAHALHLPGSLVIGASVDYREGFVGCLRAFMVNGQPLHLRERAAALYGVSPGCVGKCASGPCLNGGTCLEGYSGYTCDCQWTPFKGPICADEIGVNLRSHYYVRYDFETTLSTLEEYIRVGFTTTEHHGMIFGVSSRTGEYLNLMMSTSGHLRLVFDFGFERQEIIIKNENFALGQIHDVQIKRTHNGERLTVFVDNYEPQVHTFNIRGKADAQFNDLLSIYVGRNESMGTGEGFVGCISRVQFDDHMPLRRYFQESRRSNVHAFPEGAVREDTCGIEPVTYAPPEDETRPPPTLPPGVYREPWAVSTHTDSAILGGVLAVILAAVVIMAIVLGRYVSRHKGEYLTYEDSGAKDAPDADTAVVHGVRGHDVAKKREWFI
ncbi:neurexin-4 [Haemaphysalis longicornis]